MCVGECSELLSWTNSLTKPAQKMNGRFFAGRRVEASLYAGRQRFRRSGFGDAAASGDENEKNRLDEFAKWLMEQGES